MYFGFVLGFGGGLGFRGVPDRAAGTSCGFGRGNPLEHFEVELPPIQVDVGDADLQQVSQTEGVALAMADQGVRLAS